MTMFQKLVAIEPVSLIPSAEQELSRYPQQRRLQTWWTWCPPSRTMLQRWAQQ